MICELLILDDVAAAVKYGSCHRMDNAWLISTLQGSDEIHTQSLKVTSE
jgi:hypothetical protein